MTTLDSELDSMPSFAVYSAGHAYNRVYKPLLDVLGLTFPQYLVMILLWAQDRQTVGQICARLLVEASTVTPLLQRLENQGLLRRIRDTEDRRLVWAQLTGQGRDLQEDAAAIPGRIQAAIGWDENLIGDLTGQLVRLRQSLAQADVARLNQPV